MSRRDPSHPTSTRLQKWLLFSMLLASFGVGTDLLASAFAGSAGSAAAVLGRGELYMVSIGMLFSAAGELLYERTRLERSGSWQITVAVFTMMLALFPAGLFGLAKAGESTPTTAMAWSLIFLVISTGLGVTLIVISGAGSRDTA